jgi:hypothetical protein
METEGIEGMLVETHNGGKALAFWSVQAPLPTTKGTERHG